MAVAEAEHSVHVQLRGPTQDRRSQNAQAEWEWDQAAEHAKRMYDRAVCAWDVHAMSAWGAQLTGLGV